jgi:hypothetical protein|tara:strand:- start:208 stop:792 length:585 start_codon:yes stop_codon:yes gene_type:complete
MKNLILLLLISLFAVSCSQTTKIDVEKDNGLNLTDVVPKWYLEYPDKKKDKNFIYGTGTSTSPDLQLAKEKATLIAKAEIADIMHGEMNEKASMHRTETGNVEIGSGNKTAISKTEITIINKIQETKVQGYENWKTSVSITSQGEYRVYIGLKLPMGEFNKLYDMIQQDLAMELSINSIDEIDNAIEEYEEELF